MTAISELLEEHHKGIIYSQLGVILFFVLACTLNGVIPVCHWLFGCDHMIGH